MTRGVHPHHYRVIFRTGTKWTVEGTQLRSHTLIGVDGLQERYGMTNLNLVTDLFRINGGKPGYYLANLWDRKYYYCGSNLEDVRAKLLELGVDQEDPRKKV